MTFDDKDYNEVVTLLAKQIVLNQELDFRYKSLLKKYTFLVCENDRLKRGVK